MSQHIPVTVISTRCRPQQLLLPGQICKMSPRLIAVFLRLQQRGEVDPGPHLLAGELVFLATTDEYLSPAVAHDGHNAEEVPDWL